MRARILLSLLFVLSPTLALACACGCGIFDVQTGAVLPTRTGGIVTLEYDFLDQSRNWAGNSHAPSANNDDKEVRTAFVTASAQYMFNRSWGLLAAVPYAERHFEKDDGTGQIVGFNHNSVGDVRVEGIYSGFSGDMSSGITFGLKLPTGDYSNVNFDRDTQIGSGSTDLLLGAYHRGVLSSEHRLDWFTSGRYDQPVLITGGYRPGAEVNVVGGLYYDGGVYGGATIAPIVQLIGSYHLGDRGPASAPDDSGYRRVLFSPGLEVDAGAWKLYGDVALPIYEHVNGNQLVADSLFKFSISRRF